MDSKESADWAWLGPPLDVRPLFPVERGALLELLAALEPADWRRGTVCPGWDVQDVVSHVLHDYVRRLAGGRDGQPGPEFGPGETLPAFLARANENFVRVGRQFSPRLLIDLLAHLGPQLDAYWAGVDLAGPAGVGVSWAAPGMPSPAWLDVAREYTEFWVHQQQVRDAVRRPGATEAPLMRPVLDTFLRALPHTLRSAAAPRGTAVRVTVPGPAGGRWTTVRGEERWVMAEGAAAMAAEVEIDADTLWRLASRGIDPETARERATVRGDQALGTAVLEIVSIVW